MGLLLRFTLIIHKKKHKVESIGHYNIFNIRSMDEELNSSLEIIAIGRVRFDSSFENMIYVYVTASTSENPKFSNSLMHL